MALKDQETQFITQFPNVVTGQITGFIAASFRVWSWQFGAANTPVELVAIAMNCANQDAIIVKTAALCFVCDGGFANFLYAVDTSNAALPVILSHVDLSAP